MNRSSGWEAGLTATLAVGLSGYEKVLGPIWTSLGEREGTKTTVRKIYGTIRPGPPRVA